VTVGRHVENIYGKTGLGTRASVTLFAVQQGIIE
jgi:DNA-binding NarL/FixJ family response regulator